MSINSICKAVLKVSEEEIEVMEEVVRGQLEFHSPLRMATTARQRALGGHNLRTLNAFRNLRRILRRGEKIAKP